MHLSFLISSDQNLRTFFYMYIACGLMLIFCILYYEDILVETQSILDMLQHYALASIIISFYCC